jgi:hypothetical protein
MNSKEFERLCVGDRVKISAEKDWNSNAIKDLDGKILTVRAKTGDSVYFKEFGRSGYVWTTDWSVKYALCTLLESLSNEIPPRPIKVGLIEKKISTGNINLFVQDLLDGMIEAGLPSQRVPTEIHLISKILSDWLDKTKIEAWLARYLKEEMPEMLVVEYEKPVRSIEVSE